MHTIAIISSTSSSAASIADAILFAIQRGSQIRFILDDRENAAVRLLSSRGFRNVTIYHLGDRARLPTKIANSYTKIGGYLTYTEIEEEIKEMANEIVS